MSTSLLYFTWYPDFHVLRLRPEATGSGLCFSGHTHPEGVPSYNLHKIAVWDDSGSVCHIVRGQSTVPPFLSLLHHQPMALLLKVQVSDILVIRLQSLLEPKKERKPQKDL